jgi:hypothetical protein
LAELLKHQDLSAKAWERRLITIAAYILPEEWLGDLQEELHDLVGWTKIVTTVGRIFCLAIPLIQIKFQDIVSPKAEAPLLALVGKITVPDIYLDPAKHILKNFRVSIIEMEKICAQLQTFSSTLVAKSPSRYGKADFSMAKTVLATSSARIKKSGRAIDAAGRAADTLRDKILPVTRHARREKIDLLVFVTVLSYLINQRKNQSDDLSAKITHTIEDLGSRWPALKEIEFPEYPLFLLNFLSWKNLLFARCRSPKKLSK